MANLHGEQEQHTPQRLFLSLYLSIQSLFFHLTAKQILCQLFEMSGEIKCEFRVFSITLVETNKLAS